MLHIYSATYILFIVNLGISLVNNQHDALFSHTFINIFISLLYTFRGIQCLLSGESIVSIHHLLYITATYTEWYIPDDVLMQLILLMMRTGLLETCREVK